MDDKKNYADRGECWGPTQILSDCCNHSLNLAQKFTVISKKVLIYYVLI